jgi:hypothetical protein
MSFDCAFLHKVSRPERRAERILRNPQSKGAPLRTQQKVYLKLFRGRPVKPYRTLFLEEQK